MATRPLLLRALPPRLRGSAWSRLYRPTPPRLHALYDAAPLHFAPSVRMKLAAGDIISDSIAMTGLYDLKLSRFTARLARTGGMMVDVGANLGYFSLLWLAASSENRVVAFEPNPRTLPMLRHNIDANRMSDRTTLHQQAVSNTAGALQFDVGPSDQLGWGKLSADGTESVAVVALDETLPDIPQIDLLKIDIEGADSLAILGAEQLIRSRRVRHIWWEENIVNMQRLGIGERETSAVSDLLSGSGYCVTRVGENWHAAI